MESTEDAYEESQEEITNESAVQLKTRTHVIEESLLLEENALMIGGRKPMIQTMNSLREENNLINRNITSKFPFLWLKDFGIFSLEYLQTKLISTIDEDPTEVSPEDGETDSTTDRKIEGLDREKDRSDERTISFWFNPGKAIFNDFVFSYCQTSKNVNEFPFETLEIIACKRNEQNKELNINDSNEKLSSSNSYSKFDKIYIQYGNEQIIIRELVRLRRPFLPNDKEINANVLEAGVMIYQPIYLNSPFGLDNNMDYQDKPKEFWLGCPNKASEDLFYDCYIIKIKLNSTIECSKFKLLVKGINVEGDYKILSFL